MIAALRHNNPGNVSLPITGWTGGGRIVGLKGQPGYAEFPTMQVGFQAMIFDLRRYIKAGRNTIRLVGKVYASDPKWSANVSKLSGLALDFVLNPDNADILNALASAIIRQETGMSLATLIAQSHPINLQPEPLKAAPQPQGLTMTTNILSGLGFFTGLIPWASQAADIINKIANTADADLSAAEQAIKADAPLIAAAVDSFLSTAETVTAIDPEVSQAIANLKRVFDELVALVEKGVDGTAAAPATPAA